MCIESMVMISIKILVPEFLYELSITVVSEKYQTFLFSYKLLQSHGHHIVSFLTETAPFLAPEIFYISNVFYGFDNITDISL